MFSGLPRPTAYVVASMSADTSRDPSGTVLDAVGEHHERLLVVRRDRVEDRARFEDAVTDRRRAHRIETVAVDHVVDRAAVGVTELAVAELEHVRELLGVLVEHGDAGTVAFEHEVDEQVGRLLERGVLALPVAAILAHRSGPVEREPDRGRDPRHGVAVDRHLPGAAGHGFAHRDRLRRDRRAGGAGPEHQPQVRGGDGVGSGRADRDRGIRGHELRMVRGPARRVLQRHRTAGRHDLERDRHRQLRAPRPSGPGARRRSAGAA